MKIDDAKKNSLIEKIKKLFAIGQRKTNNDGTSNEEEAAAAMAQAQVLLTKYNLDLHVIQDAADKKSSEPVGGKRERAKVKRSAMYKWQQYFWAKLAEANYCFHWVETVVEFRWGKDRKVKRHVILGSEANVMVVQMMGEYLTDTIENILPYPKNECLSKSAISWREGCAVRLIERIEEKMRKMEEEGIKSEDGSTCTALAVRDMRHEEYVANYDARWGEPGAYAARQARLKKYDEEWKAGEAERQAKYAQEALALKKQRDAETPKQREAREAKEAREYERWQRKQDREEERERNRLDIHAYRAGHKKANDINLDSQLKGN